MFTVQVDTKSTEMDSHFLGLCGHYLDKIGMPPVMKPARLTNLRTTLHLYYMLHLYGHFQGSQIALYPLALTYLDHDLALVVPGNWIKR